MSDFKSLFRKAQASRGVVSSKQQIKKLKSQRIAKHVGKVGIPDEKGPTQELDALHPEIQADSNSNELIGSLMNESSTDVGGKEKSTGDRKRTREEVEDEEMMPPPPLRTTGSMVADKISQQSLMPPPPPRSPVVAAAEEKNIEESYDKAVWNQNAVEGQVEVLARHHSLSSSAQVEKPLQGEIPKGFFEDKAADRLARGIKPKTAGEKESEFVKFQREMESDLQELAKAEAVDAEESAQNRADQENFEQQRRFDVVMGLRNKKLSNIQKLREDGGIAQRKSKLDLPEFNSDEDSESDEDEKLTDWRAKAV